MSLASKGNFIFKSFFKAAYTFAKMVTTLREASVEADVDVLVHLVVAAVTPVVEVALRTATQAVVVAF